MDSAGKKTGEPPKARRRAAYGALRSLLRHGPPGNDGRYFKGSLRSYPEAVGLGVIDPRIRELIAAFNIHGVVSSISSCEGHRSWRFDARQTAFVSFSTRMALAARLAARIRLDQMTVCALHHYWMLDAAFNTDSELVFCLSCPDRRFNRRKLDADFAQLKSWAQEVFGSEQDALIEKLGKDGGKPGIDTRDCEQRQHNANLVSPLVQRIIRSAPGAGSLNAGRQLMAAIAARFKRHFFFLPTVISPRHFLTKTLLDRRSSAQCDLD